MYYIFSTAGNCLGSCDIQPDAGDLAERGEYFIESAEHFDIAQICVIDGWIQEKETSLNNEPETEDADSSISSEILDMEEIILGMSDTIRALRKGGETS